MQNAKTKSAADTQALAAAFAAHLVPHTDRATVVFLVGDLGAGKTTFAQGLAAALGVVGSVQSPTFVIEKRYSLPEGCAFTTLVHLDAYRIEDVREAEPLRLADTLAEPSTLLLVEWPERLGAALPAPDATVTFAHRFDTERDVSIT